MTVRVARPAMLPEPAARFVVVEASAGTGKTFFLEHRVVDLILGGGAELGQILLVTFTDKAVAELKLRVRDLLDRLSRATGSTDDTSAWTIDDAARARLRAAVTAFDHAPIFTIHGFCHRVLVEDAFAARRLFEQVQVADEVAFDTAFDALLRERFARVSPERELIQAYRRGNKTIKDLRDLLLACVRTHGELRRAFDPEEPARVLATIRAAFSEATRKDLRAKLIKHTSLPQHLDSIDRALAHASGDIGDDLFALQALADPFSWLAKARDRLPPIVSEALDAAAGAMQIREVVAAAMLPPIVDRIARDKAERGQFDYDDMLSLVKETLAGDRGPALAALLRARMPWVMIDEFQDTDPTQWEIFRRVWMDDAARGLTIVGDPKQAIYSFRGADVATYLDAREQLLAAGAQRVSLAVNRRSTAPLVAAINHVLVGNLGMPLLDGEIEYDEPVEASGDVIADDPHPPVTVLALAPMKAEQARDALAAAIGDEIEALRAHPPTWSSRGRSPAFALGQVMVLTRSNKEATQITKALRARGLPCAIVESERLFQTRETEELAAVLAAIAAPRDRSARLRALRTRFFDVPWTEIARTVDAPDHHPAIARLHEWSQLASRRAYEALFRRLVEDSRFVERALVLGGGERAVTNTWHVLELLLEEVARSRCDLHELVTRLRMWIADGEDQPDDRDVQRADTDADAIRVLTIHKAKGLEAPYVFLFGGQWIGKKRPARVLREAQRRELVVGDQPAVIETRLDADKSNEDQRLAYVALTRAQIRLYVPMFKTDKVGFGPIQRCIEPIATRGHALFEVVQVAERPEPAPAPADALVDLTLPVAPRIVELPALSATQTGLVTLSYTRLAARAAEAAKRVRQASLVPELELERAELDADERADEPVVLPPGDLPRGASSGQLVHEVLEVADLELARSLPLDAWSADRRVASQLVAAARTHAIDTRHLPHAARIIHRALTTPFELSDGSVLPSLVTADAIAREVEFAYPLPAPGRGLVRGYIDALARWNDELWVIDYKTDVLADPKAAREHVYKHYLMQARLYAVAAERVNAGAPLAGLVFAFVRYGLAVPIRIDDDLLANRDAELASLSTVEVSA